LHLRLIRSLEQIGTDNDYPELPSMKYKYLQPNHIFPEKKTSKDNPVFEVYIYIIYSLIINLISN